MLITQRSNGHVDLLRGSRNSINWSRKGQKKGDVPYKTPTGPTVYGSAAAASRRSIDSEHIRQWPPDAVV